MIPDWLVGVANVVVFQWVVCSLVLFWLDVFHLGTTAPVFSVFHWFAAELRPFYLPAATVIITSHAQHGDLLGWNTVSDACLILNWFFFKDIGDDDRWKRRRTKLVEKVQRLGARLVVVPVPANRSVTR